MPGADTDTSTSESSEDEQPSSSTATTTRTSTPVRKHQHLRIEDFTQWTPLKTEDETESDSSEPEPEPEPAPVPKAKRKLSLSLRGRGKGRGKSSTGGGGVGVGRRGPQVPDSTTVSPEKPRLKVKFTCGEEKTDYTSVGRAKYGVRFQNELEAIDELLIKRALPEITRHDCNDHTWTMYNRLIHISNMMNSLRKFLSEETKSSWTVPPSLNVLKGESTAKKLGPDPTKCYWFGGNEMRSAFVSECRRLIMGISDSVQSFSDQTPSRMCCMRHAREFWDRMTLFKRVLNKRIVAPWRECNLLL